MAFSSAGGRLSGYDVLPGQAYEFTAETATPSKLGHYRLGLGLDSMQVTSFTDQGTAPLRLPVQVSPVLGRVGDPP